MKAANLHDSWTTLRQTLAPLQRTTTSFRRRDGRTLHVRKTASASSRHVAVSGPAERVLQEPGLEGACAEPAASWRGLSRTLRHFPASGGNLRRGGLHGQQPERGRLDLGGRECRTRTSGADGRTGSGQGGVAAPVDGWLAPRTSSAGLRCTASCAPGSWRAPGSRRRRRQRRSSRRPAAIRPWCAGITG